MSSLYLPREMIEPPQLDLSFRPKSITPRYALLINPFYRKDPHASFGKHVLTPSLALTSIAAATPPDWHVEYWDENLLQGPPPLEPFPQVVGITVHLTFARRSYELADWFRRRGALVILGGLHVNSCPDEAAAHADAIALGEGTQVWPVILRNVQYSKLAKVYRGSFGAAFRLDPPPRRDLIPRESFLTTTSITATRGCYNRCGFCYLATEGLRQPYMMRDVEQVIDEIRRDAQPYVVFTDNNLGANRPYLRRLCAALRPLNIIWSAAVSIDVSDEKSLVREMALAGCTGVFVGFESLTDANLVEAKKRTPPSADYARRVRLFHENGIQVNGSFVFGFDHDRPDVFESTIQWIEDNRLECATFHILTPYPGTPLFKKMQAEGRLLHTQWDLYDTAHAVFRPLHMAPRELEEGYAWCYRRLFSHASIRRRRPTGTASAGAYLVMSYLYKRSNWLWRALIRHQLVSRVWRPLIEFSRWRHLRFRRNLDSATIVAESEPIASGSVPLPTGF